MLRFLLLNLLLPLTFFAQETDTLRFFERSPELSKKRLYVVAGTEAALYTGSIIGLNSLWYDDYPRSDFHSFNDNDEWLQMDKAGHVLSSYYIGRVGMNLLRWSGVERKKTIWYGGLLGFAYLGTVEALDGFSSAWGFSSGDLAANALGTALLIGQEYAWEEQRITLKFSSHRTNFPRYRPDVLGRTRTEQIIKDYNGQTYWLSVNVASFLGEGTRFPQWLNLAFGYGAEGMVGGKENPVTTNSQGNIVTFPRYRQYYLSFDIDLTKLGDQSPFMRALTNTFGFLKIPAPAIGFDRLGTGVYLMYY